MGVLWWYDYQTMMFVVYGVDGEARYLEYDFAEAMPIAYAKWARDRDDCAAEYRRECNAAHRAAWWRDAFPWCIIAALFVASITVSSL